MRKMRSLQVVVEDLKNAWDDDVRQEVGALQQCLGRDIEVEASRLTFLDQEVNLDGLAHVSEEHFLASAVLLNFKDSRGAWHSYMQRAIVALPKLDGLVLLNNYIHNSRLFPCRVRIDARRERSFRILGTYFCQQNSITSVCAHAALSMTLSNYGTEVVNTERVNSILGIDHKRRKLDTKEGLSGRQVEKVITGFGLNYRLHNFFENPNTDYAEYIYRYLEGRQPSLLIFSTDLFETGILGTHVVPIIGHTMNTDIWRVEAEMEYNIPQESRHRSSAAYVDHLIIHDDNFGMYLCLPVDSLRRPTLPKNDPMFRAYSALSIIPKGVRTPAELAELAGAVVVRSILDILTKDGVKLNPWMERLRTSGAPMVIRTHLVEKGAYLTHLKRETDFSGNRYRPKEISTMASRLPKLFWLSEITLPDLYTTNRSKIVDFIHDCNGAADSKKGTNLSKWIQMRTPSACYVKERDSITCIPLSVSGHIPLFKSRVEYPVLEWGPSLWPQ